MKYYKLYHYSKNSSLHEIDPKYYGQGVSGDSELRRGRRGGNKSFYYTKDQPEACVRTGSHRYEIYLPETLKTLIYDEKTDQGDPALVEESWHRVKRDNPQGYPVYMLYDDFEALLQERGFKGFRSRNPSLSHVIALFCPLSTAKPSGNYTVHDYITDKVIEVVGRPVSPPASLALVFANKEAEESKEPVSSSCTLPGE